MSRSKPYEDYDAFKQKMEVFTMFVDVCVRHRQFSSHEAERKLWLSLLTDMLIEAEADLTQIESIMKSSLLYDKKKEFGQILAGYKQTLNIICYSDEDTSFVEANKNLEHHLEAATYGFQHPAEASESSYQELLSSEYSRYKKKNQQRIEDIYQQDYEDEIMSCPNEQDRKGYMCDNRRRALFADRIGKLYHDNGRDMQTLSSQVVNMQETDYDEIEEFFEKYLSYEVAQEKVKEKGPIEIPNLIFKDNVDVTKVMLKLIDLEKDKTIKAQAHWYVVYKVFKEKDWFAKDNQTRYREQINLVFLSILKTTKDDFDKIPNYYRKKGTSAWDEEDSSAPQGCDEYIKLAKALKKEFTDERYAKPGRLINSSKTAKMYR